MLTLAVYTPQSCILQPKIQSIGAVLSKLLLCYIGDMPTDIVTTGQIGEKIRKRRRELGFSQEQLAEQVGVSYQQIQRYENGGSMLNVENVQRLAKALKLPVSTLFEIGSKEIIAEPPMPYNSDDEKKLLRSFRNLKVGSDRALAMNIVRRLAQK